MGSRGWHRASGDRRGRSVTAGRIPDIAARSSWSIRWTAPRVSSAAAPRFTVNIGLIVRGRPLFGLVYAPALADFYRHAGPR